MVNKHFKAILLFFLLRKSLLTEEQFKADLLDLKAPHCHGLEVTIVNRIYVHLCI